MKATGESCGEVCLPVWCMRRFALSGTVAENIEKVLRMFHRGADNGNDHVTRD